MFSDPVIREDFFDRRSILDILAKRVDGLKGGYRQNIAILGRELLGKTSLIQQFLSTYKDKEILPIYIDLRTESFPQFAYRFMGGLLYNFLKLQNMPKVEDFNILVTNCVELLPRTVEDIRRVEGYLEKGQFDQAYQHLLDLTAVIKEESGKRSIVILDEFHKLCDFKIANSFANLGKKILVQKDTMYIIASSEISLAKEIMNERLSLPFGNFEIIELGPFDFDTSKMFLDEKLKWVNVPSVYKRFLIALTNGHPFYLDALSLKLKKIATEKKLGKVPLELIAQVLEDEIFNSRGILNQYMRSLIDRLLECRGYETYVSILLACADGHEKLSEVAKSIKKKVNDISKPIAKLIELDLIERHGSFYRLSDPVLEFWLKSVYKRRKTSFIPAILGKSEEFRQDAREMILRFMNESKKNILERVKELFTSFKNDIVEMDKKKYKLPHFAEVESRIVRGLELPIVARWGNKYWISQIEEKKVKESDVAEFAQKCKKSRYNVQRKILIALKDLDINAKLLAKEEKIWVWGLGDINLLLDLYGKPLIVK